jgi:hypothetical protein
MFFRDRLPKKKMHLVGMNTLLILLSLGLGYHHPRGQDITKSRGPSDELFCKYCKKTNHVIENCYKLKNKEKRNKDKGKTSGTVSVASKK